MNNFFTQLKTITRTNRLSQSEKQAMRVRLYNHLEQNPLVPFAAAAPARPVPSTYFFYSSVFSARYMVPVALILIVGLGSGTAFAAQGALPGEPLYAIKINVNEAVQSALATSPIEKAEVHAQLATHRLEEAEALAANGALDASKTAVLASNFTEHAKAAVAVTNTLKTNDPGTAAQLGADFNSTLAAHGAILTQIGDDSKSDETMHNSNTLAIAAVQQEAADDEQEGESNDASIQTLAVATVTPTAATAPSDAAGNTQSNTRVRTFAAVMPTAASATATSASSTTTPALVAKAKGKAVASEATNLNGTKITNSLAAQASTSIAAMSKDYAAVQKSLDADTAARLSAQIAAVQTQYAQGNYVAAIRMAIKLDIYFKAGKKINIKLLSGLLGATTNSSDHSGKGGSDDQDQNAGSSVNLHL